MPKMKTHKGMKKRIRVTKRGKVLWKKPGGGHLMAGEHGKKKRGLRKRTVVTGSMARRMARERKR